MELWRHYDVIFGHFDHFYANFKFLKKMKKKTEKSRKINIFECTENLVQRTRCENSKRWIDSVWRVVSDFEIKNGGHRTQSGDGQQCVNLWFFENFKVQYAFQILIIRFSIYFQYYSYCTKYTLNSLLFSTFFTFF